MNYKIDHILSNKVLGIKQLEYQSSDVNSLDLSILRTKEKERFLQFKSLKRKLEFYYTRKLIQEFDSNYIIEYSNSGKPHINEGHISISHSQNTIIVGHSKSHIIGIDIEFIKPKILKIRDKFLSQIEKDTLDIDDIMNLTIIWSLKEAIYKMKDLEGVVFKEHIHVHSVKDPGLVKFTLNNDSEAFITGIISKHNYIISYCYLGN